MGIDIQYFAFLICVSNFLKCTFLCIKNFVAKKGFITFAVIMKKSTTTITPMLLKSRCKGDKQQVVIRINHNGRYYLNIGNVYACANEWDDKKHRLKRNYPNADIINKLISDKVYEIEQRLYSFTTNNKSFTAKELCSNKADKSHSLLIADLMDELCADRNLTDKTRLNYADTLRRVREYIGKDNILLNELNAPTLRKFADYLKHNKGLADGTIQISISHLAAIWNYAISKRIASRSDYPMDEWKYLEDYKQKPQHKALTKHQMILLENYYITNYVVVDQASMTYSYTLAKNLISLKHKELYLSLFLIGYRMQGLALADLLSIRKEMISFITRNGIEYMVVSGIKRQKTGVSVEVVVEMDDMSNALLRVYLDTMDERGGWLFPIYSGIKFDRFTDTIVSDVRKACGAKIASVMSSIANEIGEDFPKRITYYMCRHTFATVYMEYGGGNILALASMLGHNVASTTNYVKELRSVNALIDNKKGMFD